MVSTQKQQSNQKNGRKSAGPATAQGKAISSQNARTHGVLSARLFLEEESREDFDALLNSLAADLRPSGTLELLLVERVAVAIWKQRRLNSAESASIEFAREKTSLRQLAAKNLHYDDYKLYADSDYALLEPGEYEDYQWLDDLLQEIESAASKSITHEVLAEQFPGVWKQLQNKATNNGGTVAEHLVKSYKGDTPEQRLQSYLAGLRTNVTLMRANLDRRHKLTTLANHHRISQAIPENPELMTRYQTSLDNELYKALKALREAQSWRQKSMEAVAVNVTESQ